LHKNVYKGNYLSYQDDYITQSAMKETKGQKVKKLPIYDDDSCSFDGYDSQKLMLQTAKLRNLITKRGTFEMLIPLCEKDGILERQAYNEIPPRVEYRMTNKGQELIESILNLIQWMIKWS
jgi:hypothetical protein